MSIASKQNLPAHAPSQCKFNRKRRGFLHFKFGNFMLKEKILNKEKGLVLYGLTPPKAEFDEAKLRDISDRWTGRIESINADGLVLYEVQDEDAFRAAIAAQSSNLNVLVGATSSTQKVRLNLARAYEIAGEFENLAVGGVCIAERHAKKGDEPQRMRVFHLAGYF